MPALIDPPSSQQTSQPTQISRKRNILYVVHRYAPFPGGSENYVKDMAEETLRRGHFVAVLAGEHEGDLNGVHVTSNPHILMEHWDLIVVHGGDVAAQNFVLERADKLGGPVMYLLILPSNSPVCVSALHKAKYLGCSTIADWRHVKAYNAVDRAVTVRHGINVQESVGDLGFRELFGITTRYMILSSGGYWPNKGFNELIEVFNSVGRTDMTLVLTGYDNRHQLMPEESQYVKPFLFTYRSDMLSALRCADLYVLNSTSEGFGLVLLEAMLNGTPWVARNIAGAETLREFGVVYDTKDQLMDYLKNFQGVEKGQLAICQKYVIASRQIRDTVSDILRVFV